MPRYAKHILQKGIVVSSDAHRSQDTRDLGADERPLVTETKVSARDLDQVIEQLSESTTPYFRPGGTLMPHRSAQPRRTRPSATS